MAQGLRIEAERLVLRRWTGADRDAFTALNADPEVMRYFPAVMSREESDAAAARIDAHFDAHGFGLFALEAKDDREFIGFTGFQFVSFPCPIEGELEIGWRLARTRWRQGLAFEAASACLAWLWRATDIARVVSMTAEINAPSRSLMAKLGLVPRPELDFAHPRLAPDSPINRHVVYVMERGDE